MIAAPNSRTFATALALALAVLAPALTAQGLTPEQIVALKEVGAVALSPDGRRIAFTLTRQRAAGESVGRAYSELWIVPAIRGEARPVIQRPQSASAPAWSPDGERLAFIAQLEAHPQAQVYAVSAGGGDLRQLTRSFTPVLAFAWSPDGRSVAYTAREAEPPDAEARRARGDDAIVAGEGEGKGERHVQLWVQPVGSGVQRAVTPANFTVRDFAWSPDGATFALQVTDQTDIDAGYMFRRLVLVPAAGGEPQPLAEMPGKLGPMAWSPDGARLAYLAATSQNDPLAQSVFAVHAAGGEPANLTPGYEGTAEWVGWLDAETILFTAVEGTVTTLNRVRAGPGNPIQQLGGGEGEVFHGISLDRNRATFATAADTRAHPDEVFVGTVQGGTLRRVTEHNPVLDSVRLATQETIDWTGPDGWSIEGVLVRPLDAQSGQRYPLAILPHGGPEGVSLDGWTTRPLYPAQLLAARGYAVLMPNYRGSGGRGVAFSKGDHRDLGGEEFDDVLAGIDHLAAQGLIDPERVGISGTSYGGYFSAWAATRHTDRFKAAITFAGISNWASFTGTTDIPYEMSLVHWDLWWFDNPGLAWDRSPLAWVKGSRTATLVAHGLADERVHPEQSLELHTALKILGLPTGLVLYPREPHGLRERSHELDFMRRIVEWFDRYVKEAPRATSEGS